MKQGYRLLLRLTLLSLLGVACTPSEPIQTPKIASPTMDHSSATHRPLDPPHPFEAEFRILTDGPLPETWRSLAHYFLAVDIRRLLFLSLARTSPDIRSLLPEIATRWTLSPDRLRLRVTLRNQLYWSDGDPLDAEDIVFTHNLYRHHPELSPVGFANRYVAAVSQLNPFEVLFTFTKADPKNIYGVLLETILPSHVLDGRDPSSEEFFRLDHEIPTSAGYQLSKRKSADMLLFKRRDSIPLSNPNFKTISIRTDLGDPTDTLIENKADIALSNRSLCEGLRDSEAVETTILPSLSRYVLVLNAKQAPFDSAKSRQRIADGLAAITLSSQKAFPYRLGQAHEPTDTEKPSLKAKAIQKSLSFELTFSARNAEVAKRVADALSLNHLNVALKQHSWPDFLEKVSSNRFQAYISAWNMGLWGALSGWVEAYRKRDNPVLSSFSSSKVDGLLMREESEAKERNKIDIWQRIHQVIDRQKIVLVLAEPTQCLLRRPTFAWRVDHPLERLYDLRATFP